MEYFTLDEIAEKLKVSKDTIKRVITRGDMKALKIGSQWRVSSDQLTEYLEKRTYSRNKRKSLILK